MKQRLRKTIIIVLPFLFLIALFEIANIADLYKDVIETPEIDISLSNKPQKLRDADLKQLHEEGKLFVRDENIAKFLSVFFFTALMAMLFYENSIDD